MSARWRRRTIPQRSGEMVAYRCAMQLIYHSRLKEGSDQAIPQRMGGTISVGARHERRAASSEQARGFRSRSKQIWTSRSRGNSWPLQVTIMDCADNLGLA